MPSAIRVALCCLPAFVLVSCGTSAPQAGRSAIGTDEATLAELRRVDPDASRLLAGGQAEFERRLAAARGLPVVVNQWASWCGPCRAEFPFFQRLARRYRGKIAFLGVNSRDSSDAARRFLSMYPTPGSRQRCRSPVSRQFVDSLGLNVLQSV